MQPTIRAIIKNTDTKFHCGTTISVTAKTIATATKAIAAIFFIVSTPSDHKLRQSTLNGNLQPICF
jgi:hypothetical protein